jgi:hypothetical protein
MSGKLPDLKLSLTRDQHLLIATQKYVTWAYIVILRKLPPQGIVFSSP